MIALFCWIQGTPEPFLSRSLPHVIVNFAECDFRDSPWIVIFRNESIIADVVVVGFWGVVTATIHPKLVVRPISGQD